VKARSAVAFLSLLITPAVARAQHTVAGGTPPSRTAPREATQFDFLIGQWELDVRVPATGLAQRIHGTPRILGNWKAWRAFDGWGVEDEMRLMDASGNPLNLLHGLRVYDATAHNWSCTGLDVYRARFTSSTAEWQDAAMTLTGRGTDAEGRAQITRTRFTDITPTSFKWRQERSIDDGRTWTEALRLEAKRVAAAAPR
jgi:hypothetical protein